jgi:hypothetical protein
MTTSRVRPTPLRFVSGISRWKKSTRMLAQRQRRRKRLTHRASFGQRTSIFSSTSTRAHRTAWLPSRPGRGSPARAAAHRRHSTDRTPTACSCGPSLETDPSCGFRTKEPHVGRATSRWTFRTVAEIFNTTRDCTLGGRRLAMRSIQMPSFPRRADKACRGSFVVVIGVPSV